MQQMKHVFCKKLAACLCMKPPASPSIEPPLFYRKRSGVAIGDRYVHIPHYDNVTTLDATPATNETAEKILQEMRDLQKTRLHYEEEERYEDHKENKTKKDWMLAAAVLDRICAILFTITFVAGTVIFIGVIVIHAS